MELISGQKNPTLTTFSFGRFLVPYLFNPPALMKTILERPAFEIYVRKEKTEQNVIG